MAGFDLSDIAKHYEKMSDSDIIRIATEEAQGLKPGVLEIIQNEVQKRNLNPNLVKGAAAQRKQYTRQELVNYAEKIREIACPVCQQKDRKLNGTINYTVKSFIIVSTFRQQPVIACPECLDKQNNSAITSTLLLGWWGFPWGILKTPVYVYKNWRAKNNNHAENANDILLSYTLSNIGQIETYLDNPEALQRMISIKS